MNEVTIMWLEKKDFPAGKGGFFGMSDRIVDSNYTNVSLYKKGCYKTCDLEREFEVIWSSI